MEDEGDEIAGAEDEGVGSGLEAGEGFAVDSYDAGEAEVDSVGVLIRICLCYKRRCRRWINLRSSQEGWCNCQKNKVDEPDVVVKRRIVNQDSSNISNTFHDQTNDHCGHVSPCLVLDAKEELYDDKQCEYTCEDSVSGNRWQVVETGE